MKKQKGLPVRQAGQIILILVLVMTVALSIGISVTQRSLSDIATSTKVEESSRAFSAAEAGIDKAIQNNQAISNIPLGNESTIQSVTINNIPAAGQALEYPPITKEQLAHVWLANPQTQPPSQFYNQQDIDIYWGLANITTDKPAVEVTVIYLSGVIYQSKKFFLDSDTTRVGSNKFQDASLDCNNPPPINTSEGDNRAFFCKTRLTFGLTGTPTLMLLRARILYSSGSHPFAVQPRGGICGNNTCSLPVQARTFTSIGTAGQTTRKVKVLRVDQVVPFYFDYGIFSAGEINK